VRKCRDLKMPRPLAKALPVLIAGLIIASFGFSRSHQPVYAGKPLSDWLDAGYEPATMALQEIGPQAVPWIFARLRRDHPGWEIVYAKARRTLPDALVHVLPPAKVTEFDEFRAANLLVSMGPPVLPALREGLQDPNPAVGTACEMALREMELKIAGVPPRLP